MQNRKDHFKRININLEQRTIDDLDRLVKLSPKYTTRTQLIEYILERYLDDVKQFNPYFN